MPDWTWGSTIAKCKVPPQVIVTYYSTPWDDAWKETDYAGNSLALPIVRPTTHVAMHLSLIRTKKSRLPRPRGRFGAAQLYGASAKADAQGARPRGFSDGAQAGQRSSRRGA